jgi:Leucine-rich repeat (LRR) protein
MRLARPLFYNRTWKAEVKMSVFIKITGIVLLSCFVASIGYAQKKEKKPKKYKSLEKALKKPLEVKHLQINWTKTELLIDSSIGQLKNLEILTVRNAINDKSFELHLPLEVFELTNLRELRLFNVYSGSLEEKIDQLTELRILHLAHMNFEEMPTKICNLKNLEELDLTINDISQLPDCFSQLTKLKQLSLANNAFREFPVILFKIDALEDIVLNNREGNEGLETTSSMNYTLKNNKIDSRPKELDAMKNLKKASFDERYFIQ